MELLSRLKAEWLSKEEMITLILDVEMHSEELVKNNNQQEDHPKKKLLILLTRSAIKKLHTISKNILSSLKAIWERFWLIWKKNNLIELRFLKQVLKNTLSGLNKEATMEMLNSHTGPQKILTVRTPLFFHNTLERMKHQLSTTSSMVSKEKNIDF